MAISMAPAQDVFSMQGLLQKLDSVILITL